MGLSETTLENLKLAKRGKSCRFVLLYKGTAPVQLVAFRKGSVEKHTKEAKEAGSGQVAAGVITGSGDDLRFQLSRADGFERPPITSLALKNFLGDAGFKCKPLTEVVDSIGPVLDSDEPLVRRFLELRDAALTAADVHPERAEEINKLCLSLGALLEQEPASPAAAEGIAALERLVTVSGATPAAAAPADQPAPAATQAPVADDLEQFKAEFANLIKLATPLVAQIGDQVKKIAGEARASAGKLDWPAAREKLSELAALISRTETLRQLRATTGVDIPPDAPTLSDDERAAAHAGADALREQLGQLESLLVSRGHDSLSSQLAEVAKAVEGGSEEAFERAAREIHRIEVESEKLALDAELNADEAEFGRPKSNIVYQKSRLAWDAVVRKAMSDLQQFKRAAASEMAADPELADQTACLDRLDELLDDIAQGVGDALDAAGRAETPADSRRAHQAARELVRRRAAEVAASEELELMSDNEVAPTPVRKLLVDALNTLDKAMGG